MVVTDNNKIAERARELKDLGFLKERRYLHRTVGFNYRMTNIQAAIGLAQLERIKDLAEKRRRNAALYNRYLRGLEGVVLPAQRPWAKNCYWMYSLLAEKVDRERLRLLLKRQGIDTRAFFIPMHRQPVFLKLGLFRKERYPVSEYISARGLYLPSSPSLSERQIRYIAGALKKSIARLSG